MLQLVSFSYQCQPYRSCQMGVRAQLRNSFGSRGLLVWGSNLVLLFAIPLSCSYLCLLMEFLTVLYYSYNTPFWRVPLSLVSLSLQLKTSSKPAPGFSKCIYFYLGAAVSFRMLLIGPLVTTGKVTWLSNSFWAAALRNLYVSHSFGQGSFQ